MAELRRSRERAVCADDEGFPPEALVVRGPRGAVSYEDQRYGALGFREVFSHEPDLSGRDGLFPCPRLDGVPCSPDSATRAAVARWEREGAFDSEEATFALLERQYVKWFGGDAS